MSTSNYSHYRAWKVWQRETFGLCTLEQAVYFSEELRRSGIESVAGKDVLEIGFGNGGFATWAKNAGANYHGTEMIDELVVQGAAAGFSTYDARQPLEALVGKESVDLIVAFDVFEHLEMDTLLATLRSGCDALRPMGRIIARVPSGDSPFSRAIQHGDMTHHTTIGSSMVQQLAATAGLAVDCVREPAFPLWKLGIWVFLRRMLVAWVRAAIFGILRPALMGGGRPVLTPNMVFVLVKL